MKDEDSTKVKIDTKIDFTILDKENLQIVTSHQSALNDVVAAHQVEVVRLRDEGIRQALLKMGWKPPGMAPSIHEDNARTLQGIIDDLLIILGAADGERTTDAARRAATKQPAHATQPAEVTDEQIESCALEAGFSVESTGSIWAADGYVGTRVDPGLRKFASAILALRPVQGTFCEYCGGNDEEPVDHCMDCTRPVQVPMTDEERKLAAIDWSPCVRAAFNAGVKAAERHHGITAQAKTESNHG